MVLPRRIQKEAEEAERIQQELYGDDGEQSPEEPETTVEESEDEVIGESEEETLEVEAQPVSSKDDDEDAALWKQRYKTLQGMYDAEVPRLHQQLKTATQEIEELRAQIQSIKESSQEDPDEGDVAVTESEIEAYGPELVDLQKRVARQVLREAESKWEQEREFYKQKISELEAALGNVSSTVESTVQERFLSQLTQLVPNWETINEDQRFLQWLDQVDAMTGLKRKEILDDAVAKADVGRVAAIFNAFSGPSQAAPKKSSGKDAIERQIVPRKRQSTATTTQSGSDQRVFTTAEIDQFYLDMARGRVSAKDAARIEKEINKALEDGRIVSA